MPPMCVKAAASPDCCEEGPRWKLCHGALTVDFSAGCSSCSMTNNFMTNAVLIERATSCWHLHQLISQITQYFDIWLSVLLQSELKMKSLKVEGARAPVPHSWRRHCVNGQRCGWGWRSTFSRETFLLAVALMCCASAINAMHPLPSNVINTYYPRILKIIGCHQCAKWRSLTARRQI